MRSELIAFQIFIAERFNMQSRSVLKNVVSLPAQTIPSSRSADGLEHKICAQEITHWKQERRCLWCGTVFSPKSRTVKVQRFCGTSCSAKWRMTQPDVLAKVHSPDVAAKRGAKKSAWLRSDDPKAIKEMERIRSMNPTSSAETRAKISRTLKAMKHKPSARGGNGKGMTEPQAFLMGLLPQGWTAEFALSLGKRMAGYPTCYKLDLANSAMRVCIEVDGLSHGTRKAQDEKKTSAVESLGWKVLRFSNKEILNWRDSGMPKDGSIFTILEQLGIHLSV